MKENVQTILTILFGLFVLFVLYSGMFILPEIEKHYTIKKWCQSDSKYVHENFDCINFKEK